jgi:hypothetical protein
MREELGLDPHGTALAVAPVAMAKDNAQATSDEKAMTLLRVALELLDEVQTLLETLSPVEIWRAVVRKHPGAMGTELSWSWTEYERRHQFSVLLFTRRHSLFVSLAREHFQRRERQGQS